MSYSSSAANRVQESQESELYLSRYGSQPPPSESDYDFDQVGSKASRFSPQEGEDPQVQYRRLADGQQATGDSQDYLDAIDDIQNGIDAQDQQQQQGSDRDPAQASQNLKDLKTEIEASELPNSVKAEFLNKQKELAIKLNAGPLEDVAEIEDLKTEFEDYLKENPSFARRIADNLKDQGVETTESEVRTAMKKIKFTEQSLTKLSLPADNATLLRLMGLLKEVNPDLAQTLSQDADKGFSPQALAKVQGMLAVLYPDGANLDLAVKMVDLTVKGPWDNAKLKNSITGERVHYDGDYNNRFYEVNAFADRIFGISLTHSSGDLSGYLNGGRNAVDNGARNKGLEVRKFLTGLYEISNHNPYLFRHYLKQLPDDALLAMKDVLDYRGGGGNDAYTTEIGSRWDTDDCSNILRWAVNGGALPAELESEMTGEMDTLQRQAAIAS